MRSIYTWRFSSEDGSEFKAGDLVWLKSGGPQMTIESVDEPYATCVWFEKNTPIQHQYPLVLTKSDPEGGIVIGRLTR